MSYTELNYLHFLQGLKRNISVYPVTTVNITPSIYGAEKVLFVKCYGLSKWRVESNNFSLGKAFWIFHFCTPLPAWESAYIKETKTSLKRKRGLYYYSLPLQYKKIEDLFHFCTVVVVVTYSAIVTTKTGL